jgi:subtilisin family serine protease
MKKRTLINALLCGALLVPALAGAVEFDQGVDASAALAQAKTAAQEASGEAAQGKQIQVDPEVVNGEAVERRIVVFKKSVSGSRRMSLVRSLGGIPTKDLRIINAVAVVTPKIRMANFERQLASLGDVLRVEEDFVQNWLVAATPIVPVPVRMPALMPKAEMPPEIEEQKTPWGIDRVNAKQAWSVTRGAGVKVAVVDTGIDIDHPDLNIQGGYNAIDPEVSFDDDNGHGTHVAGTIAGQDNGEGVVGVAPDVLVWGVKVLSGSGSGTFADVIEGMQWCAENGMAVANFSLGASRGTQALADAVKAVSEAGVAIIAAAGNSGRSVGFPAAYPEALAVAASDVNDKTAGFSSRGPEVEVIAPGVGVNSTWPGGGYRSISGTSMATPHVVGLAALAVANGASGIDQVRAALLGAAVKLPEIPEVQQGSGMIDAARLVGAK